MLYQRLRARKFHPVSGDHPKAASEAKVTFRLTPPWPFGTANGGGLSRVAFGVVDDKGQMKAGPIHPHIHRGTAWAESAAPLRPLQLDAVVHGRRVVLNGNTLVAYIAPCSIDELHREIADIYYWFPVFLNLDFGDPPAIESVTVELGGSVGAWVPRSRFTTVFLGTHEKYEQYVHVALNRSLDKAAVPERRLLAALEYFYSATRMLSLGEVPGEFLAEVILNFAKTLDVLFSNFPAENLTDRTQAPGPRDRIRAGLKMLGYSAEEIENSFIPAVLLRNKLGIGHPATSILDSKQLEALHDYTDDVEKLFRQLLKTVLELPAEQRSFLASVSEAESDPALVGLFERLSARSEAKKGTTAITTITKSPPRAATRSRYPSG